MSNDEQMVTHVDLSELNEIDAEEGYGHDGQGNQHLCYSCDYWHEPLDVVKKVLSLDYGTTYDTYWVPNDADFNYEANVSGGWRCDHTEWVTTDEPEGRQILGAWFCPSDEIYYVYGPGVSITDSDVARTTAMQCCNLEAELPPAPLSTSTLGYPYASAVDLDAIAQKH